MIVAAYNPDTDNLEKTYVAEYRDKNVTSLPVKNGSGFTDNRPILIGKMGGERSELNVCSSVATDKASLNVNSTLFEHNADDPIYAMPWDTIKFFRGLTVDGPYDLVATVPIDVDNEEKKTRWDDVNWQPTYYYRTGFYNTITLQGSELSDPVLIGPPNKKQIGKVIDIVVRRVRDTGFTVLSIDEYIDIAQEVNDDLITQAHKPYRFLKKNPPLALTAVAGQNYIPLPDDLWKFNYVEILTSSGGYNRYDEIRPMTKKQFEDRYNNNQTSPQNNILEFALDEETNRLLIYPTPSSTVTGAIVLHYYKNFNPISDVGDFIETPNSLIYRYKMMAEYYSAKSEVDRQWAALAQKYETKYGNEVVKLQRVNRLDTGTPRSFGDAYRRRRRYHL
jgi:hypothetical protein